MIGGGDQIAGIGEAVRGRLGLGDAGGIDAKVAQITAVQCLLDSDGAQSRLRKGLHRRSVRRFRRRNNALGDASHR